VLFKQVEASKVRRIGQKKGTKVVNNLVEKEEKKENS